MQHAELLKDFYFIYVLTGSNYIKPVIKSFKYIPKEANVVILTNTPGCLRNIKVNFNLIVADLETYRDDWSRKNEYVIPFEDEELYMKELIRLYDEGYRYPMGIMRFAMNWAVRNNVSKFVVTDCGCKICYEYAIDGRLVTYMALKELHRVGKEKNIIFGHPRLDEFNDKALECIKLLPPMFDLIKKYVPSFNYSTYPTTLDTNTNPHQTGSIAFDGCVFGFWFHDISALNTCFNFWNDWTKICYENGYINPTKKENVIVEFENVFTLMVAIFSKYFNTTISEHYGIVRHIYHPENDFFNQNKLNCFAVGYKAAATQAEFIELNKDIILTTHSDHTLIDGLESK